MEEEGVDGLFSLGPRSGHETDSNVVGFERVVHELLHDCPLREDDTLGRGVRPPQVLDMPHQVLHLAPVLREDLLLSDARQGHCAFSLRLRARMRRTVFYVPRSSLFAGGRHGPLSLRRRREG